MYHLYGGSNIFMEHFLFMAYDFLTKFIPFLIVFFLFCRTYRRRGIHVSKLHITAVFLFAFYIICVFNVTGAGTVYETRRFFQYGMGQINIHLVPFSEGIDAFGYIANVVMLMPFGFLLPLLSGKAGKPGTVFLSGFLFSLLIELSQLFNYRATDIDDLILNTLGAVLGYEACRAGMFLLGRSRTEDSCSVLEPFAYIFAMFLGHYFLYDGLWMASLLYGF